MELDLAGRVVLVTGGSRGMRRGALAFCGRDETAEEVADVIVFLLSNAARFVSATVLRADGGQSTAIEY